MSADTDKELVRRVQQGERAAFDLLYQRYQHKIQGLVARYLRQPADIDDVVQEAFIKAYRALPRFRGHSAFYTWLYRIAVNTAKNHLAATARRPQGVELDGDGAIPGEAPEALRDTAGPEGAMRQSELQAAVVAAIDALPEELRLALTLREFDGLSYAQIAEIMSCPVGTVRSRIFRARESVDRRIRPLTDRPSTVGTENPR